MVDERGVRNDLGGLVTGPVVQAGSIHHVTLASATQGATGPPRQLPLAVRDFTGRADHLAALNALLPAELDGRASGAVVISAVDGTAGIGKTTLAVWWAHQVQDQFPDGTLHVNLRGYGPGEPATAGEVLDGFLRALGISAERMPIGLEAQATTFRSMLAGRRVLIVLDNANSANQVRPLLPGTPGCVVVVTSRDSLTGLVVTESAHRLTLDLLSEPEALELVTGIIGPSRAIAEPAAVVDLIRLCAHLPLALRIAAARIAARSFSTVAEVVAELTDDGDRINVLSQGGDERAAVRAVFDWSYLRLTTEQALLFRRLGLHPGPEISLFAAAAVAELSPTATRRLLEELATAHLVEPVTAHRYRVHDLLRLYALEQAHRNETVSDREAATRRILDWYARTADAAIALVEPHFRRPPNPAGHQDISLRFDQHDSALAWCKTERINLTAATRCAAENNLNEIAWKIPLTLSRFYLHHLYWDDWLGTHEIGLSSARRARARYGEAELLNSLGLYYFNIGRIQEAQRCHKDALSIRREIGDRYGEGVSLNNLGITYLHLGPVLRGYDYCRQALEITREVGSKYRQLISLSSVGSASRQLGRLNEAASHFRQCVDLSRELQEQREEAEALGHLGGALREMGQLQESLNLCLAALEIHGKSGYTPAVGHTLDELGVTYRDLGRLKEALDCHRRALTNFKNNGRRRWEAYTLENIGLVLERMGKRDAAERSWREALGVLEELDGLAGDVSRARILGWINKNTSDPCVTNPEA